MPDCDRRLRGGPWPLTCQRLLEHVRPAFRYRRRPRPFGIAAYVNAPGRRREIALGDIWPLFVRHSEFPPHARVEMADGLVGARSSVCKSCVRMNRRHARASTLLRPTLQISAFRRILPRAKNQMKIPASSSQGSLPPIVAARAANPLPICKAVVAKKLRRQTLIRMFAYARGNLQLCENSHATEA
jgi:hypothetical protein